MRYSRTSLAQGTETKEDSTQNPAERVRTWEARRVNPRLPPACPRQPPRRWGSLPPDLWKELVATSSPRRAQPCGRPPRLRETSWTGRAQYPRSTGVISGSTTCTTRASTVATARGRRRREAWAPPLSAGAGKAGIAVCPHMPASASQPFPEGRQ